MSIANLKDSGNQGNNMPWQWKMLQGLQAIYDEVSQPLTCVEDSVTICNANIDAFTFTNIAGEDALNVNIAGGEVVVTGGTGFERIPTFLRPSSASPGSGIIAAGAYSVSFASVGTADATVGGITLKPGETLNFDAGAINNTLSGITYSTSTAGAELIIITLT
jgi:hypothetical protein